VQLRGTLLFILYSAIAVHYKASVPVPKYSTPSNTKIKIASCGTVLISVAELHHFYAALTPALAPGKKFLSGSISVASACLQLCLLS
jgi:hypothetical protein